jgi:hypothetical protein
MPAAREAQDGRSLGRAILAILTGNPQDGQSLQSQWVACNMTARALASGSLFSQQNHTYTLGVAVCCSAAALRRTTQLKLCKRKLVVIIGNRVWDKNRFQVEVIMLLGDGCSSLFVAELKKGESRG